MPYSYNKIREITRRQFDAYCYVRSPFLRTFSDKVAWYEAFDRKVLGVLVVDFIDGNFGYLILGRDKRNIFRPIRFGYILLQVV